LSKFIDYIKNAFGANKAKDISAMPDAQNEQDKTGSSFKP